MFKFQPFCTKYEHVKDWKKIGMQMTIVIINKENGKL